MTDTRCPCGGVILADTEDWTVPICGHCYDQFDSPETEGEALYAAIILIQAYECSK